MIAKEVVKKNGYSTFRRRYVWPAFLGLHAFHAQLVLAKTLHLKQADKCHFPNMSISRHIEITFILGQRKHGLTQGLF